MQQNINVMQLSHWINIALYKVSRPIRHNITFFIFMYSLGVLSAYITLHSNPHAILYQHLYTELFVDLYLLCMLLCLLPKKVLLWVRWLLSFIFYTIALIDAYCFLNFGSVLTPTMLLLAGETNGREAGEFLHSCLSLNILESNLLWILLLALLHITISLRKKWLPILSKQKRKITKTRYFSLCTFLSKHYYDIIRCSGLLFLFMFIYSAAACFPNKRSTYQLMTCHTIGEVEHTLTQADRAELYLPVYRLIFSIYANVLTSKQLKTLITASQHVKVDSCSYTSPQIVLIIGESYGKYHSQLYGYAQPTTPRQLLRERLKQLVKFTDVVSPWNLTSFVFKHLFSLYSIGDRGQWCDYPLFPELFRKAGYHVCFITNQFLPKAREAVYDFSGGFFLNNPTLSKAQFDMRNKKLHRYDDGLLQDYDQLKQYEQKYNLTIFHLMGQHVSYNQRYPHKQGKFCASQYSKLRPHLSEQQREVLAYYDNAVLYNDSIVDQIMQRFEKKDAIVIYVPDHGEECYEENRGFICRNHSARIDYPLAKYEFEIPFWIWCSQTYIKKHPQIFTRVKASCNRRFMTDALPHLLLYLAGIHTPLYHPKDNLLSPNYNEMRKRMLKGVSDYDILRHNYYIK